VFWLLTFASLTADADPPFVTLDLARAETATAFGSSIALVSTSAERDALQGAVRKALAKVKVDGRVLDLECGNYNLPVRAGKVQVDCPVTSAYLANSTIDHWRLEKEARIRVWPSDSPFMTPDEFSYPLKQRWFLTHTQMANEPTYVDRGEQAKRKRVYYHAGLDMGGAESFAEVFAATDGVVVSLGKPVLAGHEKDTPVQSRYDVIYLLDSRGWYYRYSHLYSFEPSLKLGDRVHRGQKLGIVGKEGGSGGWSHLHFEAVARQPSGKWGTLEAFAFLWEAYLRDFQPDVVAVARPHRYAKTGEVVALDARKSYVRKGAPRFQWKLSDGRSLSTAATTRTYPKAGTYCETLEVRDTAGHVAYDFATVNVYSDTEDPITINASYTPGLNVKPGMRVTFLVRTFGKTDGEETWDFGDGSPMRSTKSDGNASQLAKDGYARIEHTFAKPGDYIVTVKNGGATTRLWVPVKAK
jgi:murein DD-endopeptidase MepM/ murein hydrolase activator NlpD